MNQINTAPADPMIITQRQPSRPRIVWGTSRYDSMATTGTDVRITRMLNAM